MTERIEHTAEAVNFLRGVVFDTYDNEEDNNFLKVQIAQAHATLALVEQQRFANLIAYWQLHTPRSTQEEGFIEVRVLHGDGDDVDTIVREGLGL